MSRNANKKKSSISGGEKAAIGELRSEHLAATLFFFGGGGHDKISGNLNLFAFGVEQPDTSSLLSSSLGFFSTKSGFSELLGLDNNSIEDASLCFLF